MNRRELQRLARLRLAEARTLFAREKYEGAYYLSGYALECALKACVARKVRRYDFPDKRMVVDSHTHDLEKLINVSELRKELESILKADSGFESNWMVVKDWSEQNRYELGVSRKKAADLYGAITRRKGGVLTWLKKYW